jgi:thiol-disulfide isomerase/thioredoxin
VKAFRRSSVRLAVLLIAFGASGARADSLGGRWDATLRLKDIVIPFRLDISGEGASLTGTLFNGDERQTTTSARIENGVIVLNFEHYLTKITAAPAGGELEGKVEGRFLKDQYITALPFHAKHYVAKKRPAEDVPSIAGLWEIEYNSPKSEKAWRFIVKQSGPDVSASILRVDGDTGALVGSFEDGKFVLSHFDGSRPLVAEVTPAQDGTLRLRLKGAYTPSDILIAYRPQDARAKGLPEPANFVTNTTVRDPNERFSFKFPDVNGKMVSSDDPQFKNKVVLVIVTGTWCPNCHDEAQYLVQLYPKYHDKGLEIVALDFEEPEQQGELRRERAFVKKYGVPYAYLIAGAPAELSEKVPQAVNLDTWPATIFVGRDGRVKLIHAGFAAPASGEFNNQLKDEFTSTIERLLSDDAGEHAPADLPKTTGQ